MSDKGYVSEPAGASVSTRNVVAYGEQTTQEHVDKFMSKRKRLLAATEEKETKKETKKETNERSKKS